MSQISNTERAAIIENLRGAIKPGATVYTILRHVSATDMSRRISVVTFAADGSPRQWDYAASKVLGWSKKVGTEGVTVVGDGMDMGFHLVESLCRAVGVDCQTITHRWL